MQSTYLEHHGIKGQKWGVRNGPPYPLGSGVKRAIRKTAGASGTPRKKENTENVNGVSTGSKLLDNAYNKIASMDEKDWKKVKRTVGMTVGIAHTATAVAALASLTAVFASDPELTKTALNAIADIGLKNLDAETVGNIGSKVTKFGLDKAGQFISEKGMDIAKGTAKKMFDGLNMDMSNHEIASTLREVKKNATKEDYSNFLRDNWDVIKKDPKTVANISKDLLGVKNKDGENIGTKLLTESNAFWGAVNKAEQNRNINANKKLNAVKFGSGALATVTSAFTSIENAYRKKDSPIVKDAMKLGKTFVDSYFTSPSEEEKKNGK